MLIFFYVIILLGLIIIIPKRKKELKVFFIILCALLLEFIINKTDPSNTKFANQFISFLVMFFYPLYFIYSYGFVKINKVIKKIFLLIFVTLIYLILLAAIRNLPLLIYINEYRLLYHGIFLFIIGYIYFDKNSIVVLFKYFALLNLIIFVLALIEYFGPINIYEFFVLKNPYKVHGEIVETESLGALLSIGKPVTLTFGRYNNFGNYIALLSTFLISASGLIDHKKYFYTKKISLFLLGIIAVLLSGNRVALLSYIIGILIIIFYNNRKYGIYIISSIFIIIIIFYSTFTIYGWEIVTKRELTNPLQRMLGIFALLINPFSYQNVNLTTFGLSILLIPYIFQNPIIGVGKYFQGGYPHIFIGSGNTTDATFFFQLAEYGIIGVFLFYYVFYYLIKEAKNKNSNLFCISLSIFIVLLLQTITDMGFYLRTSNYTFFIVLSAILKNAENKIIK